MHCGVRPPVCQSVLCLHALYADRAGEVVLPAALVRDTVGRTQLLVAVLPTAFAAPVGAGHAHRIEQGRGGEAEAEVFFKKNGH